MHGEPASSGRSIVNSTESRHAPPSSFGSSRPRSVPSSVKPSLRGNAQAALVRPDRPGRRRARGRRLLEADARQHRGHLGRDPLPDRVGAHPVADLERAVAAARMQAAAAEQPRLVRVEHAVDVVLVRGRTDRESVAEQLDLLGRATAARSAPTASTAAGARCSRRPLPSGAARRRGSQQRMTRRSVSIRYGGRSLPLDRGRRLRRDVEHDAVHGRDLVDDAATRPARPGRTAAAPSRRSSRPRR